MKNQNDVDGTKAKKICAKCVGDNFLRKEILANGKRLRCSYCGRVNKVIRVGVLADYVEDAFRQHYLRTSDQLTGWDQEPNGYPVVDAIVDAAGIPEQAGTDVQQILEDKHEDFDAAAMGEESEFAEGSYYEESKTDTYAWQNEWAAFEQSLKTEARFFSQTAEKHLTSVFDGIETMRTRDDRPLLMQVGPGTSFDRVYRARVFQSEEKLIEALCRPDRQVGPPSAFFANAGRMNAKGISVFYGADSPLVAVAEVRPPVGSSVIVAQFEFVRPLQLLDLTALSDVSETGSVFDPTLAARLERAMFLRSLSRRITKPVMPDDEAFEYLPTQAVADFLATSKKLQVDGIAFPSVQAAGNALNIVLFHKAARVKPIELPPGTEIRASAGLMGEDGWEPDYSVVEEVPPPTQSNVDETNGEFQPFQFDARSHQNGEEFDMREVTLAVNVETIQVHEVKQVEFKTEKYDVRRHRWVKSDPKF